LFAGDGVADFVLGLYEEFISRIGPAEVSDAASRVLVIHSLGDLKPRLAKVILMVLMVRYFEYAVSMRFEIAKVLSLFASGIALIGRALFLANERNGNDASEVQQTK